MPTSTSPLSATPTAQPTVTCPKCGATVREIARFCQRCHATMRYECPACSHQQRSGGNCEKCGVNFIKYVGAVVAAKQAEADAIHEKIEQRSTLMKNLLFIPLTGGISLIRQLLLGRDKKS
jgi:zinc-ribbon domain